MYIASFLILVPPNIIDEESTLSSVAVRENLNLTLTCKAKGFPEPKITWKREDGNDIVLDRKKKSKYYTFFWRFIFRILTILLESLVTRI